MKPQEVKPKAQTDWLGFRKGVRTYVQRASLMMPSPETATKATMSLHVTAEHMSSKFTIRPFERSSEQSVVRKKETRSVYTARSNLKNYSTFNVCSYYTIDGGSRSLWCRKAWAFTICPDTTWPQKKTESRIHKTTICWYYGDGYTTKMWISLITEIQENILKYRTNIRGNGMVSTILIGIKVLILKNTLSFRLPNKWGRYLYHILAPLESYSNGYWLIFDTQIWRKAERDFIDLFCDGVHITNKEFFSIIQKSDYYIVSGYFQLNKAAVNDPEDADIMLIVKINDSIYVEMDTEDPSLFGELCTNAQKKILSI